MLLVEARKDTAFGAIWQKDKSGRFFYYNFISVHHREILPHA